ncbi:MAG: alpha/beta fold hydrolase [Bacteroidetes bacterium]|nr:alpha/beta fold hydrolase [Bacteroidota bacterium]
MKKTFPSFSIVLILLLSVHSQAQLPEKLKGTWHGKLHANVDLRMVVHFITDSLGRDSVLLDSPDQGAMGIPGQQVHVSGDSVFFALNQSAHFRGKWDGGNSIHGVWVQGMTLTLDLKKGEPDPVAEHPQTPKPPFPYTVREVEFDGAGTKLHYGATLTIPPGEGPFAAAVLITGSGPQDRDETLMGHKTFAVLADYLTRNGLMVLRVDDRGVGKSTGSFSTATSADFADDVNESLNYLLASPKTDKKKIGLIGHSEGGMIAPMVAGRRDDIYFIVLLAGPGIPIIDLMALQSAAVARTRGVKDAAIDSFSVFYRQSLPLIVKADNKEQAQQQFAVAVNDWVARMPKNIVFPTTGIYNDTSRKMFISTMVQQVYNPWFRYFLQFDPQPYLQKLHCKVLAINGSRDIQVLPEQNLGGITASLKKSKSPSYEVKEVPGLNHLFQTCRKCTMQEYGELEETFSPVALDMISSWLKQHVL